MAFDLCCGSAEIFIGNATLTKCSFIPYKTRTITMRLFYLCPWFQGWFTIFYCSSPTLYVWKRPSFLLFPALWLSMSAHFCSSPTTSYSSSQFFFNWNSELRSKLSSMRWLLCCVPRIFGEEPRLKRHSHHPTRWGTVNSFMILREGGWWDLVGGGGMEKSWLKRGCEIQWRKGIGRKN